MHGPRALRPHQPASANASPPILYHPHFQPIADERTKGLFYPSIALPLPSALYLHLVSRPPGQPAVDTRASCPRSTTTRSESPTDTPTTPATQNPPASRLPPVLRPHCPPTPLHPASPPGLAWRTCTRRPLLTEVQFPLLAAAKLHTTHHDAIAHRPPAPASTRRIHSTARARLQNPPAFQPSTED